MNCKPGLRLLPATLQWSLTGDFQQAATHRREAWTANHMSEAMTVLPRTEGKVHLTGGCWRVVHAQTHDFLDTPHFTSMRSHQGLKTIPPQPQQRVDYDPLLPLLTQASTNP